MNDISHVIQDWFDEDFEDEPEETSPVFNKVYKRQIEVKEYDPANPEVSYLVDNYYGRQLFAENNKALVKAVKSFIRRTTQDCSNCRLEYIQSELEWRFYNLSQTHLVLIGKYLADIDEDYQFGTGGGWGYYITHCPIKR